MLIRTAKRIVIAVFGVTVLLLGVLMIVLPGPAFVVIPAGLAILGTEFAWAKWLLKRVRERAAAVIGTFYHPSCPPPAASDETSARISTAPARAPGPTSAGDSKQ